jgi:hypothetical protein
VPDEPGEPAGGMSPGLRPPGRNPQGIGRVGVRRGARFADALIFPLFVSSLASSGAGPRGPGRRRAAGDGFPAPPGGAPACCVAGCGRRSRSSTAVRNRPAGARGLGGAGRNRTSWPLATLWCRFRPEYWRCDNPATPTGLGRPNLHRSSLFRAALRRPAYSLDTFAVGRRSRPAAGDTAAEHALPATGRPRLRAGGFRHGGLADRRLRRPRLPAARSTEQPPVHPARFNHRGPQTR